MDRIDNLYVIYTLFDMLIQISPKGNMIQLVVKCKTLVKNGNLYYQQIDIARLVKKWGIL